MIEIDWNNVSSRSNRQHPFQSHNLLHNRLSVNMCLRKYLPSFCTIQKMIKFTLAGASLLLGQRESSKIFTQNYYTYIIKYFYENPLINQVICLLIVSILYILFLYLSNNTVLS